LGIESVPDGLSFGVLAGVNPLAGLYGYMYGTIGGALFTSSSVMAVQVTGAMSIIVADTNLDARGDPARALYTLSIMAGILMVIAGVVRAGSLLRFVPRAVMVGFIAGVGVNTVLGQLSNFTGYDSVGANRVARTFDLLVNIRQVHLASVTVGTLTLVLIVGLQRTRLGALGLVVAVAVGSAVAALFSNHGNQIVTVGDLTSMPDGLPFISRPALNEVPGLLVPALALAFVGMVQGAGVATAFPNPDGTLASSSRDFIGQGTGSILSGLFRGMPAGGSMSATALVVTAGARTRLALFVAGAVMAITIVAFGGAVAHVALPALAALLIVIGFGTIRPADIRSALKSGRIQGTVVVATFAMTILIPVPQAVLAGVALAVVLYVIEQSNRLVIKQLHLDEQGHIRESDPPSVIPPDEMVILQPYGSLFFASASPFASQLPAVDAATKDAVVIIRTRGNDTVDLSVANALVRYADELRAQQSRLIVAGSDALAAQLSNNGILDRLGEDNFYVGTEWHGKTLARAAADARAWIAAQRDEIDPPSSGIAPPEPP
jgi:SulP family sulfate permease